MELIQLLSAAIISSILNNGIQPVTVRVTELQFLASLAPMNKQWVTLLSLSTNSDYVQNSFWRLSKIEAALDFHYLQLCRSSRNRTCVPTAVTFSPLDNLSPENVTTSSFCRMYNTPVFRDENQFDSFSQLVNLLITAAPIDALIH